MSTMAVDTPARRPRRQFTDEFKTQAVRLVLEEGQTVGASIKAVIEDAKAIYGTTPMPAFKTRLTPEQIEAVAVYLASRR